MASAAADSAGSIVSKSNSPAKSQAAAIFTCPPEVHNHLFKFLDPVASTCFGLTCKLFYKIHRSFHGTVSLATKTTDDEKGRPLHELLEHWVGEGLPNLRRLRFVYDSPSCKFRDVGDILQTYSEATIAWAAKISQMINEVQEFDRRIEELTRSALPVPMNLYEQCWEKVKDMRRELEGNKNRIAAFSYAKAKMNQNLRMLA